MKEWINNLPNSTAFWLTLVAIVLVFSIGLPAARWEWLRSGASEGQSGVTTESTSAAKSSGPTESNSSTVRNIGFIIAGALALVFAVWRGVLSQRQAKTAERQADTALRQIETAQLQVETSQSQTEIAQQGLLNERYQRGAEMLGSEVLSVRLGGIYALQRLADEHPEQYHLQIVRLLCAFVRNPPGEVEGLVSDYDEDGEPILGLREDVEAAMHVLGRRTEAGIVLGRANESFQLSLLNSNLQGGVLQELNLSGAFLYSANLSRTFLGYSDLSHAFFGRSDLSGARLPSTILSTVSFEDANLSNAMFPRAYLYDARFAGANLTGADLRDADLTRAFFNGRGRNGEFVYPAIGLTQAQLDVARSDPNNPPILVGVLDAETGKQLVWQGKSLEGEGEES